MKNSYLMILVSTIVLAFIVSCGRNAGPQGPQGPTGPQAPTVSNTITPIEQMVQLQNDLREIQGQEQLVKGLTCHLYTVPNTTIKIVGATLTSIGTFGYSGVFNQSNVDTTNGLNILPVTLQPVYQNWIVLKCTGYIVLVDSGWHSFSLSSDDGSNLYLDGALLVNNDGMHSLQTVSASKFLGYGFHSFEVDYLQGSGQEALILNQDGSVMGSEAFYY